jgi:hypothetical protein
VGLDRHCGPCARQVLVAQVRTVAPERRPDGALDDLAPFGAEGGCCRALSHSHEGGFLRRAGEEVVELPHRRLHGGLCRRVAETLTFLQVGDLLVHPAAEPAPAGERLRACVLGCNRLDARHLGETRLPTECRDTPQLFAADLGGRVLAERVAQELPGHPFGLVGEGVGVDALELGVQPFERGMPLCDVRRCIDVDTVVTLDWQPAERVGDRKSRAVFRDKAVGEGVDSRTLVGRGGTCRRWQRGAQHDQKRDKSSTHGQSPR